MTADGAINTLMDVDTGVDDAMALALAVASTQINPLGVTTVAGNVSLAQATSNTLRVLDHLGANEVPVYRGMARPLSREHFDAAHFHGQDGLGGAPLVESVRSTESITAPEFIVQTARQYRDNLALIFVGPLTNLAVALALEPELPDLVSQTIVMGGAFDVPGNTTPHAEFNVAVDPEAARWVAESNLHVTWIGLDVTHQANLYRSDWIEIAKQDTPAAVLIREVCRQSFEVRNLESVHLHDPLAVGVALRPSLIELRTTPVSVDTSIRETAGMTRMVTDSHVRPQSVATGVDSGGFRRLFGDVLGVSMSD